MSEKRLQFAASALCILAINAAPAAVMAQGTVQEIVVHPPANPLYQTREKKVSYGDLNLHTSSGQKAILARIRLAGRQVCSPVPNSRELSTKDYDTCYDGAVSRALGDLGNSDVSALAEQTKGAGRR